MNKNKQKFFTELGTILKKIREDNGISQQTLADKVGCTRNCIANWETGRRTIDITELMKVCAILNVDTNELIKKVEKYVY